MKSAVILFPGSNRDGDVTVALEQVTGVRPATVWYAEPTLPRLDLIVLPGGFAYGDYLRTGAIAARAPVMREIARRAEAGTPVIGVCNGFQVLCEAGLLPGALLGGRARVGRGGGCTVALLARGGKPVRFAVGGGAPFGDLPRLHVGGLAFARLVARGALGFGPRLRCRRGFAIGVRARGDGRGRAHRHVSALPVPQVLGLAQRFEEPAHGRSSERS